MRSFLLVLTSAARLKREGKYCKAITASIAAAAAAVAVPGVLPNIKHCRRARAITLTQLSG